MTCSICPRGKVSLDGESECADCIGGQYQGSEGQSICPLCAVGQYQPLSGKSSCVLCDRGQYQISEGSNSSCILCELGFFADEVEQSVCEICSNGYYATEDGDSDGLGVAEEAVTCSICPRGKVSLDGESECADCIGGQYQGSEGQSICPLCAVGQYQPLSGKSSCVLCDRGQYQISEGSNSSCILCELGYFADEVEQSVCEICSNGYYATEDGDSDGLGVAEEAVTCSICPRGKVSLDGESECADCIGGRYQSSEGQSICPLCAVGQYQPLSGKSSCVLCDRGQYQISEGSNSSCILCELGFFADEVEQSVCEICSNGYYATKDGDSDGLGVAEEAVTCSICPRGKVSLDGESECADCIGGQYQGSEGQSICPLCAVGQYQPLSGKSSCVLCDRGQYQISEGSNSSCILCELGYFADEVEQSVCEICSNGYYATEDGDSDGLGVAEEAVTCSICPRGKVSLDGESECADCIGGQYQGSEGQSICPLCAVGQYQPLSGKSSCVLCDRGQYQISEGSNSSCILCELGYFADEVEQSVCEICSNGYYATEDGDSDGLGVAEEAVTCSICPRGKVSLDGESECADCIGGQYQGSEGQSICPLCAVGQYQPLSGKSSCVLCDRGQYQISEGSNSSCILCELGYFADEVEQSVCEICSNGYYATEDGDSDGLGVAEEAVTCSICPRGKVSLDGESECADCIGGQYQGSEGQSICPLCAVGQYQPLSGKSSCVLCDRGQYQISEGSNSSCILCELGYFADEVEQSVCEICSNGYYATEDGDSDGLGVAEEAVTCSICPRGKVSLDGESECADCIGGQYQGSEGQSICPLCAVGQYQPLSGKSSCVLCDRGQYQISEGSNSSCILCELGYFADEVEQSVCEICSNGYYATEDGDVDGVGVAEEAVTCAICPPGTVAGAGQSECGLCFAGQFQGNAGELTCTDCPVGQFQNKTGRSSCVACAVGQYQDEEGSSSSCTPCEPGFYTGPLWAAGQNRSVCDMCGWGTYSSLPSDSDGFGETRGGETCSVCPAGMVSGDAQSACNSCPAGQFQPAQRQSFCFNCSEGYYSEANLTITACTACPPGRFGMPDATRNDTVVAASNGSAWFSTTPGRAFHPQPFGRVETGMVAGRDSRDSCHVCGEAQFQLLPAQTACEDCPAGHRCTQKGLPPVPIDSNASLCSVCIAEGRFFGDQLCWDDGGNGAPFGPMTAFFEPERDRDSDGIFDVHQVRDTGYGDGKFGLSDALYKCVCPEHFGGYYCDEDFDDCSSVPCTNGGSCVNLGDFAGNFRCDCAAGWGGALCETPLDLCAADPCGVSADSVPQLGGLVVSTALSCLNVPGTSSTDGGAFGVRSYECTCQPGFFGLGSSADGGMTATRTGETLATSCEPCPYGKFSSTVGATNCDNCPKGWFNYNGTGILSSCWRCEPGYQCPRAFETQVPCEPGHFQPRAGQTKCHRCDPGFFIDTRASNASACSACTPGKYALKAGATECSTCRPGWRCPMTTEEPLPCVPGFFSNITAATSCVACPNGFYAASANASQCNVCPAGSQCACGSTDPVQCLPGSVQAVPGTTSCMECAPGLYHGGNSLDVTTQTVSNETFGLNWSTLSTNDDPTHCLPCPVGYFCPNRTHVLPCPRGSVSKALNGTVCEECAPGLFSHATASTCESCPVGYSCARPDIDPVACTPGTFQSSSNATHCDVCEPGWFAIGNGTSACTECPVGHRCSDPRAAPEGCPLGRFQDERGATSCETCPTGRYHGYATAGEAGRVFVGLVPTGADFGDDGWRPYADGTPPARNGSCPPCLRHHYCPFEGMTEAISCPDKTSTYDVSLPNGGAARVGLTECIACPETQVDGCALCIAGKYCTPDGSAPDCAPGKYADVGDLTECKICAPGRFQNRNGSTACKVCDFATLVANGEPDSVVSVPTQASFYPFLFSNVSAATSCHRVGAGFRCGILSDTNTVSSSIDDSGGLSASAAGTCDPSLTPKACAAGTYREEEMFSPSDPKAAGQCVECAAGRFAAVAGASGCVDCVPGWYQDRAGQTACLPCGLNDTANVGGDFQNEFGQSQCLLCAKGTYQNVTAATSCTPCKDDFSEYVRGFSCCVLWDIFCSAHEYVHAMKSRHETASHRLFRF